MARQHRVWRGLDRNVDPGLDADGAAIAGHVVVEIVIARARVTVDRLEQQPRAHGSRVLDDCAIADMRLDVRARDQADAVARVHIAQVAAQQPGRVAVLTLRLARDQDDLFKAEFAGEGVEQLHVARHRGAIVGDHHRPLDHLASNHRVWRLPLGKREVGLAQDQRVGRIGIVAVEWVERVRRHLSAVDDIAQKVVGQRVGIVRIDHHKDVNPGIFAWCEVAQRNHHRVVRIAQRIAAYQAQAPSGVDR